MDGAHTHLLFNHFPIIGSILSLLVLIAGFLLKNGVVKKTAMAMIVFTSVMTLPAFFSGEEAEEALEAINQAPDSIIHEHEELAEIGLWSTITVGLVALFTFFSTKKKYGSKLFIITLVMLMANSIVLVKIGELGGVIRHTEIRQPGVMENQIPESLEHE